MKRSAMVAAFLCAFTIAAQTPVRMSWQEFAKDPKRVASFRKAVATMKSMSTADPKSAAYRGSWFSLPPDSLFNVYLESKADPKKRAFVGTINFFGTAEETTTEGDRTFDVTDVLPALGTGGKLDEVNVVFEASTGRTGAHEQATFNPKANLVVGEVDFVIRSRKE